MARAILIATLTAACLLGGLPSRAVTFHRSFKNGYPAELNVSKEEANEVFSIKRGGVTYSNGRGRVVSQTTNTVIYVQGQPGGRPPSASRRPRANSKRVTPPRAKKQQR